MNAKRMIFTSIFILFLLSACSKEAEAGDQQTFTGTVMTGAQIGKAKNYCAEGLYLVAEEGYLTDQTQMLLLRIPDPENETTMLSDQQYVGKKVEVTGKYPAQEAFCRALLCACEDYILVYQIQIIQ
ncbi:MAG TPA: hypothetical protein VJ821_04720 [Anaerolineales bacterium]|nr:hypothetical protein [Anaerolineales bacterium]